MKTWNIGVIGAGLIADFHAKAITALANAKLIGFCDIIPVKAQQMADKYSCRYFKNCDDMLKSDEIDVVSIATPSGSHMEPAIAAAKAGRHVICEKPLEITLERIDAMLEAHEKSGTTLGGIFQYRFDDAIAPLKEAIDSGRFGTITYAGVYVPWWRSDEYYEGSWHGTWKLDGGGALMNQSIHMVDMLCALMPPIESVQAFTAALGHDTATAVLRFTSGALGVIYGTTASYPGRYKRFEITGTKGTVVYVEDSFQTWQFAEEGPEDEQIRGKFGKVKGGGSVAEPAAISCENHRRNFEAFLDSLEKGGGYCISGKEARKSVEVILAIYKSAAEEKCVRLA
ncbi:MAG: Gfo/Idh/MocA family protein [Planctomycetota bacterium]|jgi:predicted dehydrogenase